VGSRKLRWAKRAGILVRGRTPPHFCAMSACVSRAPPGTVRRTRFSQFRALLPISRKSGAAVEPATY